MGRPARAMVGAAVGAALGVVPACAESAPHPTAHSAVNAALETGPRASLLGPVTTGTIIEPQPTSGTDLAARGYVEEEFFASGAASSYTSVGALTVDGKWTVKPAESAAYKTRIVVRRPADPGRFNGTVVLEWFNVTGGLEADPDWAGLSEEIMRNGYAYVGVSAQALGVNGGEPLLGIANTQDSGLRASQPGRYGSLVHPGDPFSFDIVSQVGRALRAQGRTPILGGPTARHVLAVGDSQSAFFLTTYIDAVQPVARVFDGFLVHSRSGGAASLAGNFAPAVSGSGGVRIRSDLDAPVLVFETETDLGPLLDYGPARQGDTNRFRLWEVAGTAHADAFLVGSYAAMLGCDFMVNDGPAHFVERAALDALNRWVNEGTPPPRAPRLELSSASPPVVARDALGNARGGVRTPAVDVPVAALSGAAPAGSSILCSLFGSTAPFDAATLRRLYGDRSGYLSAHRRSLDKTIAAGFLLAADRDTLAAQAEQVAFPS